MGVVDKVIERRQVSWSCDECSVTESVVYDAVPWAEVSVGGHDWHTVPMVFHGKSIDAAFCSRECYDACQRRAADRLWAPDSVTAPS